MRLLAPNEYKHPTIIGAGAWYLRMEYPQTDLKLSRRLMRGHVMCVGGACIAHAQCSMALVRRLSRTLDGKECIVVRNCLWSNG